ncbi:hypothetical protein NQ314_003786 [Rhamnusium bicolor]|uniref:Uncharacterized protein n=1 Tax=Rhamnusium bicolor TaxID=1586634 RepID=A0AAV8ZNX2_9CUCU|nr:hypothetical protein NQ314_003786 [Rhamnusium bicolor]
MKLIEGGAAEEARQALKNIGHILEAADFGVVNEVYKEFFTKDFPARSTYQVGKLPANANVEIEVIAAVGNVKTVLSKM